MSYEKSGSSRMIAFAAIVFSTVAITGCLLTFPLVFHYVQTLEATVQVELDFCKTRSRDMWREMFDIHESSGQNNNGRFLGAMALNRARRGAAKGVAAASANFWANTIAKDDAKGMANEALPQQASGGSSGQCCTCHRGVAGPAGAPGFDGRDGVDGFAGEPGDRGAAAPDTGRPVGPTQDQCPCTAPAGDAGPAGPRGSDGPAGDAGAPGSDGKAGDQGPRGPPGPAGAPGQNGGPGPAGEPGKVTGGRAGPAGPPGPNGHPGAPGPAGQSGGPGKDGGLGGPGAAGDAGSPGSAGKAGGPGGAGDPGKNGPPGSCEHCPPARLAPGY